MSRNRLLRGLKPMHPGEMLREEVLPALGKSKAEIARLLGISRQTLYDIIEENPDADRSVNRRCYRRATRIRRFRRAD